MNAILEKAVEVNADAIGLSALLVSTSKQMPVCVAEQDARGLSFPVIVGGAAINRDFGRRIALLDDGARFFEPGLFYAKDAFEGLEVDGRPHQRPAAPARPDRTHQGRCVRAARPPSRGAGAGRAARALRREGADRRRAVAAVLGRAHRERHRRARAVAVLRSAQPLPALVGRRRTRRAPRSIGSSARGVRSRGWPAIRRRRRAERCCSRASRTDTFRRAVRATT